MINLIKKGGGSDIPEQTQTQSITLKSNSSALRTESFFFNQIDSVTGAVGLESLSITRTTSCVGLVDLNFGYWNALNITSGRYQNASGSTSATLGIWKGYSDKIETSSQSLRAKYNTSTTTTITFPSTIKAIKSITTSDTSARQKCTIIGLSYSGNVLTVITTNTNDGATGTTYSVTYNFEVYC